jgi:hypothetical protein
MHHIHDYRLPLPVVQKQVGHRTLKATSVYLNPSEELIAQTYRQVEPVRTVPALPGNAQGIPDRRTLFHRPSERTRRR